jgi:transcriptional/translational regulatory protein YebC/TACO1
VAIIAEVVTDNKNRAVSDIKHTLSKHDGNLAGTNAVAWKFDLRGIISIKESNFSEVQELALIDAGLLDIQNDDDGATIITEINQLQRVEEEARKKGLTVTEAAVGYVAKEKIAPTNEAKTIALLSALDDLDDVTSVYTNANV